MRTEQEIRKQAIEECIEIVKDYEGEGMTKVVHKLESLLPPEPTVDKVSDEILHRIKENISPYDSLMIGQCSYVDRKHLYEMASELLSLRTAKAEPKCQHPTISSEWKCLNCGKVFDKGIGKPVDMATMIKEAQNG